MGIFLPILLTFFSMCTYGRTIDTALGNSLFSPVDAYEKNQSAFDVDSKIKPKAVLKLIEEGEEFFTSDHYLGEVCRVFTHTKQFVNGEMYLFLLDLDGAVRAHGWQSGLLWRNLYDNEDQYGNLYVQNMITKAKEGGGWVLYDWHNAIKLSYVKEVEKDGKKYVIGAGYHPHSKKYLAMTLVRSAVAHFKKIMAMGRKKEEAFAAINYQAGRFSPMDGYIHVLDENGITVAHGDLPSSVSANEMEWYSDDKKQVHKEVINALRDNDVGRWFSYVYRRSRKVSYAQRVIDRDGNNYFFISGYYTDQGSQEAIDLVRKGEVYIERHGKQEGIDVFTRKTGVAGSGSFRFGGLYLALYDMKGTVLAHGGLPLLQGYNILHQKDEVGQEIIQLLLAAAQKGGGWVGAKLDHGFQGWYVRPVNVGSEQLMITSGLYPINKYGTARLMARTATSMLEHSDTFHALSLFTQKDSLFSVGDIEVFAFSESGICYAYGDDHTVIWRNLINLQDDKGSSFIRKFIKKARRGPTSVRHALNRSEKIAYIEPLTKNGKQFVIGAGVYR